MIGDKYKARIEQAALHNGVRRKPLERSARVCWDAITVLAPATLAVFAAAFVLLMLIGESLAR